MRLLSTRIYPGNKVPYAGGVIMLRHQSQSGHVDVECFEQSQEGCFEVPLTTNGFYYVLLTAEG